MSYIAVMISKAALYKAVQARDPRYDGRFFFGVKTTGIYCRPICPAKPLLKNIVFFSTAQEAENAGYRSCRRCRPETLPFSPAWKGKSAVVQRALKLIQRYDLPLQNEDEFAARFGLSARHLRRLFKEELGQTPKQIVSLKRLNIAYKLLLESSSPMTVVAMTSGFSSLRRFNDAFHKQFQKTPRSVRDGGSK